MAKLMVTSVYDALVEAGASESKARAAVEDVADYTDRANGIERKLDGLSAEVNLLKWMVGANVGLTVLILGRTFFA